MVHQRLNAVLALLISFALITIAAPAWAALPQGNAVKDPAAILRDALPFDQDDIRELQHRLELTSDDLRAKRWTALGKTVSRTESLLNTRRGTILNAVPEAKRGTAEALFERVDQGLEDLKEKVKVTDKPGFIADRRRTLSFIGDVEALLVPEGFEREIPADFDALPRLQGRATLNISTTQGELTTVVDGYNAPLTAGAFVDLALKGFYDGLPFIRAEDFYVLQSGDPEGPEIGYVDPKTKQERHVPLEIRVPGEDDTIYNETFEDVGLFMATPTLPFATLGTLGWAHSDQALDDGSSQFFMFLYEAELTPAGLNLVDGRNAAFGYVVDGFDVVEELGVDDRITAVKVVEGAEQLKAHA
ncbi:peptidylprolyl isomerase [Synechococcus sp. TAK9802]|uniref:peptidylprolyl isomerase n=1 Tax=Synechococcus sp. TAK9802 TaxID=1442558 RepID=UPI00164571BA|nr:peptidylprolyl isomerase [Synechococcus sp. TAK9802]QNI60354.1 cyclophilin type peptidyl-prolyl cis-trans isomerase/CLD family protein [Synechococcus sp. TAK9802]